MCEFSAERSESQVVIFIHEKEREFEGYAVAYATAYPSEFFSSPSRWEGVGDGFFQTQICHTREAILHIQHQDQRACSSPWRSADTKLAAAATG